MELKIISPAEGEFPQVISFNNEEIKKELAESLKKYEGLVYTEDNIKSAKLDRATLNKFKEAVEKKRKEVKKQCLRPYEDFESKVKEITGMVEKPILAIDGQVKAFEEKQKQEKRESITGLYELSIGDLADLLPLTIFWNEKWLNATFKVKDIETEITETIAKVNSDLVVITDLKSEHELLIKDTYLKSLDLSAALAEKTRLEAQKTKLEEHKKQQEETKVQLGGSCGYGDGSCPSPSPTTPEQVIECSSISEQQTTPEEAQTIQQDFRVWVTREQLSALKGFLLINKIKYGRVN